MKEDYSPLEKIDGIYDINSPLPPELSALDTLLLLAGIVIIISFIVYFIWGVFFSNKGKVKRQIKQLKTNYLDNKINTHDAIYQLCSLLQKGIKINHVSIDTLLPDKLEPYKKEWHGFVDELSMLRYQSVPENDQDINKIFEKSLFWVRVWP